MIGDGSSIHSLALKSLLTLVIVAGFIRPGESISSRQLKVYPLADGFLQKIYLLRQYEESFFVLVSCRASSVLSISITERRWFQEAPRFQIYGKLESPPRNSNNHTIPFQECGVVVEVSSRKFIAVRRKGFTRQFFSIKELIHTQKYRKIVVNDESLKWGLGERFQQHFEVRDGDWTIWNRDRPWEIDEGLKHKSGQTYGHQPVYLARQHQMGTYHLAYFKNTHGMMVESENDSSTLTYHSVGGNVHFILVVGNEDPQQTLERYHQYIGKAMIPPFWSMGYHQSKWGYRTLSEVEGVINLFRHHDLPIDAFWLDLDYMDDKFIFTINERTYPSKQLNRVLQSSDIKLVPLLDVGFSINDHLSTRMGRKYDIWLKSSKANEYYYKGEVWPGEVYYADFAHPNASIFWQKQLQRLNQKINFAGIWLDMNEPTNFRGAGFSNQHFLIQKNDNLNRMTIDADLPHYTASSTPLLHEQLHAYYGHLSAIPTYEYLSRKKGRPFILTRSNSVGTGLFAAHWTGDNVANWQFLKASINGNFLFQIFGIQMVGSDICGFYKNTENDLCSRWMQLAAFYPFARNHNHEAAISQQPYAFGPIHLETSRKSMKTRYALLKQMYTWMVGKNGKGSFFRPLCFQFFSDQTAFYEIVMETQFLIGQALMVAPVVDPEVDERPVYFPGTSTQWYEFRIDTNIGNIEIQSIQRYQYGWSYDVMNMLPAPPLTFLRSGHIILSNYPQTRSSKLSNTYYMFAALDQGQAKGYIMGLSDYEDSSKIDECLSSGCFYHFTLYRLGEKEYILEWNYQGMVSQGQIVIQSLLIAENNVLCSVDNQVDVMGQSGTKILNQYISCYLIS